MKGGKLVPAPGPHRHPTDSLSPARPPLPGETSLPAPPTWASYCEAAWGMLRVPRRGQNPSLQDGPRQPSGTVLPLGGLFFFFFNIYIKKSVKKFIKIFFKTLSFCHEEIIQNNTYQLAWLDLTNIP